MKLRPLRFLVSGLVLVLGALSWAAAAEPIRPKVVVVAMFEAGNDTGDRPGEFQYWVEREKLTQVLPFPQGYRDLRLNADGTVLGVVTGVGTAKSAATIMALGMDPRFDFSKTYWLVAGIAGIDAADGSLGSAVWAEWVVDGDLGHEIDAREMPAGWTTGFIPLRKKKPYEPPADRSEGEAYRLDPGFVEWAYQLTKDTPLADTEGMQRRRALYPGFPNAQRPPLVMKGDTLSSMTYWHGKLLNQWANDWVKYFSDGQGNYVTTAMEDTGTLQALTFLAKAKRADVQRVLVLRTASNFDMQPPGGDAAESLSGEKLGPGYSAYLPALDAAHRVGSVVVHELVKNWATYEKTVPKK
ncbi:MAG: purine nucleoside permease [Verrucomicrobia bacterium]|nr:purine nucleoside permease [Verrucomicrobiota bacterium]